MTWQRYRIFQLLVVTTWSAMVCELANWWPISILFSIPLFAGGYAAYWICTRLWGTLLGAGLAILTSFGLLPVFATVLSATGLFGLGPQAVSMDLGNRLVLLFLGVHATAFSVMAGCVAGVFVAKIDKARSQAAK